MKRLFIPLLLLASLAAGARTPDERLLDSLADAGDCFALERLAADTARPGDIRLRARTLADGGFRRFRASNEAIDRLLAGPATTPEWRDRLIGQKITNHRMQGDYTATAAAVAQLCDTASSEEQASLAPVRAYFAALAALPPTTIERPGETVEVPFRIDTVGRGTLLRIDVALAGRTAPFILDSGCAEMSFADEAFAREYGIRNTGIALTISGVSGSGQGWIGIADSLGVGPILLRNALFIVVPETTVSDSGYRVDAVLGCNFLHAVGAVEFRRNRHMLHFPAPDTAAVPASSDAPVPNMMMKENGLCYLRSEVGGHPALLLFDTGNVKSDLTERYLGAHRTEIEASASLRSHTTGGYGGMTHSEAYVLPSVTVRIDGRTATFRDVTVSTRPGNNETGEEGSLGCDFVLAFDRVRVDYRTMRLSIPDTETPLER